MSSATQLKNITEKLRDYFSVLSDYFVLASNTCPSFEDYNDLLVYDNLLVDALESMDGSADFSIGALTDTVHQVLAIEREFGMRSKTKAFYYDDADIGAASSSNFYQDMYGRYLNYIRGSAPEQSEE